MMTTLNQDHDDTMVITATIHNYVVKRILVDQGSLTEILYSVVATSMNITKVKSKASQWEFDWIP